MKNTLKYFSYLFLVIFISACSEDEFLDIKPETTQDLSIVTSVSELDALINGSYGSFYSPAGLGLWNKVVEFNSDIYYAYGPKKSSWIEGRTGVDYRHYYAGRDYQNQGSAMAWYHSRAYNTAMAVIDVCENDKLDGDYFAANKDRIWGEALTIKAYANFMTAILLGTQYHETSLNDDCWVYREGPIYSNEDLAAPIISVGEMYGHIVEDLEKAITLLPETYDPDVHPIAYKARHRKDVAKAMLAKVYFQMNELAKAKQLCDEILGSNPGMSNRYPLDNFDKLFLDPPKEATIYGPEQSREMIFAADGSLSSGQKMTQDRKWNYYRETRPYGNRIRKYMVLGEPFKALMDTANDLRFKQMVEVIDEDGVKYWWQRKLFVSEMNFPMFRSAEFHLMRAEINARTGSLADALADLNVVKGRAGLAAWEQSAGQDAIIEEIIDERTREMYGESNRWLDCKRLGAFYGKMVPLGQRDPEDKFPVGGVDELPWNSPLLVYDIPSSEYIYNPALK